LFERIWKETVTIKPGTCRQHCQQNLAMYREDVPGISAAAEL